MSSYCKIVLLKKKKDPNKQNNNNEGILKAITKLIIAS